MDKKLRDFFDEKLEEVLATLPQRVHDLLDEVPLHVEDYPAEETLREMGIRDRSHLCGLFTGVPINEHSHNMPPMMPNAVTIYREGIISLAGDIAGQLTEEELKRQIRITVLHELGHHHGLNEDDLEELGYD